MLPVEEVQNEPKSGDLSLDDLKLLRAATGALLNMSLKYGEYSRGYRLLPTLKLIPRSRRPHSRGATRLHFHLGPARPSRLSRQLDEDGQAGVQRRLVGRRIGRRCRGVEDQARYELDYRNLGDEHPGGHSLGR